MTSLMLALWLALEVQGSTTCPTPSEVSRHLARLLPEASQGDSATRATLSSSDSSVMVELLGPDGGLLAERRLDSSGSCAELAEAVAVILAAWQAKFSPRVASPGLPAPPPAEPPAPVAANPAPEREPEQPLLFDMGAAAMASVVDSDLAWGAKLEGTVSPFAYGLGFHLAAAMASRHTQTIATPALEATWLRPTLAAGPNLRLPGDSSALDLHADAVLAVLNIKGSGSGLTEGASDTTVGVGLAAGLRGLWTWQRIMAWVGADLLGFPGQDNLTVGNYGKVGRLPHLEVQISLGFGLGRFH
jgi:hypothetical protein